MRRLRLDDVDAVVDEIAARFRRAHASHVAARRNGAAAIFAHLIAWMDAHAAELKAGVR